MQTESVRKRTENSGKFEDSFEDLSFRIYSVKNEAELTQDFKFDPKMLTEVDKLPFYLASREVTKRFSLKPGKCLKFLTKIQDLKYFSFIIFYLFVFSHYLLITSICFFL